MFIQISDIKNLFPEYNSRLYGQHPFCLDKFKFPSEVCPQEIETEDSKHTLYVVSDPTTFQQLSHIPDISILYTTEHLSSLPVETQQTINCILELEVAEKDLAEINRRLQDFYNEKYAMGLFSESLLEILFFEGGIQALLDKCYPNFQCPMFVFDSNFQVIAASFDAADDPLQGKSIIESGGFTQNEFDIMNQTHSYKKMMQSEHPIKLVHPVHGYKQLLCTIDTHKNMGHIVINGIHRNFNKIDAQMLYLLKKAIDQQMKKDEFIRNNRGFHYEYFLRDLLDEKIAVGKPLFARMNYVHTEFNGTLYCMIIEAARSSHTLNTMHIRSVFETDFSNTLTLMYNGSILVLFRLLDNSYFTDTDYQKIQNICEKYSLYAGMGNCFRNIFQLPEYYHQALRSIELGICQKNEPSLFLYEDYYLDHMATVFMQKESASTFCHPQLKLLLDFDEANQTHLAEILYVYLICERNIATASEHMQMHRNTLVYRLKKINSLVTINYESYEERQHIILSYELYRKKQRPTFALESLENYHDS